MRPPYEESGRDDGHDGAGFYFSRRHCLWSGRTTDLFWGSRGGEFGDALLNNIH